VSATPPGVKVGLMLVGTPAFSRTSLRVAVAKPFIATLTVYSPGSSAGMVKRPSWLDTALEVEAVALLLAVMVAPGTTAPDESKTVPDKVAVTPPCAKALTAKAAQSRTAAASVKRRNLMFSPLVEPRKSRVEHKIYGLA